MGTSKAWADAVSPSPSTDNPKFMEALEKPGKPVCASPIKEEPAEADGDKLGEKSSMDKDKNDKRRRRGDSRQQGGYGGSGIVFRTSWKKSEQRRVGPRSGLSKKSGKGIYYTD